ncbi:MULTISPECIES: DUF4377 domain-containing protein [Burkholderia cepacia complex]|uniref:DUF4377 domain-containing protein n=1 Tax=Burkholderia cepacia complex TaxID=87882 RepID=UPI000679183D|nr:DUF4377 domain-containing protein [Burkholderia cenocepacia]KWU26512.1 hypothetical protein AS149_04035 [Burkholderia cenocepacia]CAG2342565.1 putative lipoprotein [Burkholderia cenocepacia]CAG2342782.1 putative lipoprotein [Burkholderia cenocepacia]CAG2342811.1 putative lipoprotein [Burkholderia cenocepacia]CAG2342960.1 putative lipoprotein [Burkholderia cenocepacia]
MIHKIRTLLGAAVIAGSTLVAGCQTDAAAIAPSAARPADGTPVTKTVYVAPQSARCTGVAPAECLQVRSSPSEPWSLWYAGIEGFAYQPGYLYTLEVDEYRVARPPADGSSIRWVLKRVVERSQVN